VLEVFVNGRTVISTRVYRSEGICCGIRFFAEKEGDGGVVDEGAALLVRAEVWDKFGESQ
jgi:hypothetical protein